MRANNAPPPPLQAKLLRVSAPSYSLSSPHITLLQQGLFRNERFTYLSQLLVFGKFV